MSDLDIDEKKHGEIVVLAPAGSLNTQTSPRLEGKLLDLLKGKQRFFVVNLRGVDYVASSALRVLLMVAKRLGTGGGRLTLCAMSDDVRKVFQISGFDRDFTIVKSEDEALAIVAEAVAKSGAAKGAAPPKTLSKGKPPASATKTDAAPEAPAPAPPSSPGLPFAQLAPASETGRRPAAAPAAPAEPVPAEASPAAPQEEPSRAGAETVADRLGQAAAQLLVLPELRSVPQVLPAELLARLPALEARVLELLGDPRAGR